MGSNVEGRVKKRRTKILFKKNISHKKEEERRYDFRFFSLGRA